MILRIKHFVIFTTIAFFWSCGEKASQLTEIDGKIIKIDTTLPSISYIEKFITPYRIRVNEILDSTLAYAPNTISKTDGYYNTTAGNLMADIVLSEANPIYKKRTGNEIDFVLLNHGGIRSSISKGNITPRTAYEVMPFENYITVAELSGATVLELASFLKDSGRAHPISGIQIILDTENDVNTVRIQGKALDKNKIYHVATSDYLFNGGDDMNFFKAAKKSLNIDYLIRNAMIDYFIKEDTVSPVLDDRFMKLN